ncbi:putative nuclear transport factor 2 [Temnothorax longispinosus]|uniref:Putative nuclear transport factor 2 n=1 Tax=Temnothorax longispinosus TaxID=300112 RepID=A0A4S2KKN3_9HYME|nr:putative nuclear transport factor 2 [Temnothorax longispinosus]
MAMNVPYEAIGKGFVQQYYAMFDDPTQRPNLINMYNAETSFMTFEGLQIQGAIKIMEKLTVSKVSFRRSEMNAVAVPHIHIFVSKSVMRESLSFQKINRIITAIDSQPMFDGGVLINVLGRLQRVSSIPQIKKKTIQRLLMIVQTDEDQPHAYIQTFILKPIGTSFYVQHDIFRLALHDTADEDPPHAFSQCFVLKPMGNSYYCQHDIFRLNIHDSA